MGHQFTDASLALPESRTMLEEALVPPPDVGRMFRARRKVRLADASPSLRLRLDACARYLQDIGNDDTADSGLDDADDGGVWVVRRAVVETLSPPRWNEWTDLATWCSGTGGRWAERRLSIIGERGGEVEIATLWVHLDRQTLMPARLPASFLAIYGEAAGGRRISSRRWLTSTTNGTKAESLEGPLRAVDFDVMGHVNNAAYWAAIEEVLGQHRDHPAHPNSGRTRAVLEFGSGIARGAKVELQVAASGDAIDIWFCVDGTTSAAARLVSVDDFRR